MKNDLKNYIKNKLKSNTKWAIHALEVIYSKQTLTEQLSNATIIHNNVGFSGCDAEILSSFYKQLQTKNFLSEKQIVLLKKKISKYAGQILEVSDKEKLLKMYEKETNQLTLNF